MDALRHGDNGRVNVYKAGQVSGAGWVVNEARFCPLDVRVLRLLRSRLQAPIGLAGERKANRSLVGKKVHRLASYLVASWHIFAVTSTQKEKAGRGGGQDQRNG